MRFSLTITISCASAPFFLFFSLPLDLALLFFENHSLCTEQVHVYVQHFNTCSQFSLLIRVFVHHCCRIRINTKVIKLNGLQHKALLLIHFMFTNHKYKTACRPIHRHIQTLYVHICIFIHHTNEENIHNIFWLTCQLADAPLVALMRFILDESHQKRSDYLSLPDCTCGKREKRRRQCLTCKKTMPFSGSI